MEGIQVGADKSLAADIFPSEFVGAEELQARQKMRGQLQEVLGVSSSSSSSSSHTSQSRLLMENIALQQQAKMRADAASHARMQMEQDAVCAGVEFSFPEHVVDSGILEPLRLSLVKETGQRIDIDALEFLSYGLQQHLTDIMEACITASQIRRNSIPAHLYQALHEMMVVRGERSTSIGLVWGPDVQGMLGRQEDAARVEYHRKEKEEETSILRQMNLHEEEKNKLIAAAAGTGKRRSGPMEGDTPWWIKEDAAEKSGYLDFDGLAKVQFRHQVAREHKIGPYASKKGNQATKQVHPLILIASYLSMHCIVVTPFFCFMECLSSK